MLQRENPVVVAELVERMYDARKGFPFLLVAVGLPAGYVFSAIPDQTIHAWSLATIILTASRIVGGAIYARHGSRCQSPAAQTWWQVAYLIPALSAALALAGLTVSLLFAGETILFAWSLATLLGAAYGAIPWISLRPYVGIPQTILPVATCAIALASLGDTVHLLMAASLVVAGTSIVEHIRRQNRIALKIIESHREIERLSGTDHLTGLWNRRHFDGLLEEIVREPGVMASLVLIDLDRFKPVNDRFGHDVGDKVLRETARRLREACGEDSFVARLGGDEFAIVALSMEGQADVLADRLARTVSIPIRVGEIEVSIGASIGLTTIQPGENPSAAVRRADEAMYARKSVRSLAA